MANKEKDSETLIESLMKLTGQVAEGTFDLARNTAAMTAMFGENWLRTSLLNRLEPERLEAMADAGHFLRDARETAGISIKELSEMLGLADRSVLEDIESGQTIMPLELMLRSASLLARHDPIPFLIKFMRTYNPALEQTLEQLGVMALPRQFERERRFVNLVRQHDKLRTLTDDEYERFIHYMDSSCKLVLEVMVKEKDAAAQGARVKASPKPRRKAKPKVAAAPKARVKAKTRPKAKSRSKSRAKTPSTTGKPGTAR
ncbi:MAG: helix-turn-helix domain-containing protein [Gammaproteobacteria bacterium]|nr:helix-turn-helix domain-containing protein [Gammaproteobacteria bacterium]